MLARAISGLPLTEENYRKATELLKELFGKTQNFTNAYMESLSKIHTPSSDTKKFKGISRYMRSQYVWLRNT